METLQALDPVESKGPEKKSWMTEGILIAVSPVIAYSISFCYQAGYIWYFRIPELTIQPSLATVFFINMTVLGFIVLFFIVEEISQKIRGGNFYLWLASAISVFSVMTTWPFSQWPFWLVAAPTVAWLLLAIVWQARRNSGASTVIGEVVNQAGQQLILAISFLLLFFLLAFSIGYQRANHQTIFLVLEDHGARVPESIVFDFDSDAILSVPFDRKTKTLQRVLIITKTPAKLNLYRKKVGPLR